MLVAAAGRLKRRAETVSIRLTCTTMTSGIGVLESEGSIELARELSGCGRGLQGDRLPCAGCLARVRGMVTRRRSSTADGSGTRLRLGDVDPSWSPDGTMIALMDRAARKLS